MKDIWKTIKEHKAWLMLALAFSFMMCVFAPFENYFSNMREFWFRPSDMVTTTLLAFIIVTAVSAGLGILAETKIPKAYILYGFVLSAFTALYVQGNYIPRPYGVLNGTEIKWDSYPGIATASLVIMVLALIFWLLTCFKIKKNIYEAGFYLCGFIMLIQVITLGTLVIQKCILAPAPKSKYVTTSKDLLKFSKDHNIIVLILDTFDSHDMRKLLARKNSQEYKDILADFTYYPDTLGGYPTTKGALPFILSGVWYENDKTYKQHVQEAYVDNPIYAAFKKNNYELGIYARSDYLNNKLVKCRNIKKGTYGVSSIWGFGSELYKLAAFNYVPHQFKKYFAVNTDDFSNFKSLDGAPPHFSDVQKFYELFQRTPVQTVSGKNCFNFYHVDGTHSPSTFGKDLKSEPGRKYKCLDECEGNLTLLKHFFDKLKKNGVYDNSSIIVMADHGYFGYHQDPIFMVKNAGEKHAFEVSDQPASYEDLSKIYIALAEGKKADTDFIKECRKNRQRRYLYYTWGNAWWGKGCLPSMCELVAAGSVEDPQNLVPTDNVYLNPEVDYKYKLGTKASFAKKSKNSSYWMIGQSTQEKSGRWTSSAASVFHFDFSGQKFDNLKVSIKYGSTAVPNSSIFASVNRKPVAMLRSNKKRVLEFIVPHDYVKDGTADIKLDILSAVSPSSRGSGGDARYLGIFIKEIKIKSTKDKYDPSAAIYNEYTLGTVLQGSKDTPEGRQIYSYALSGLMRPEDARTWTSARDTKMRFVLKDFHKENLRLNLKFDAVSEQKDVKILVNRQKLQTLDVKKSGNDVTADIPGSLIKEDGIMDLTINIPHAEKLGKNEDKRNKNRRPGLAIKQLSINKAASKK